MPYQIREFDVLVGQTFAYEKQNISPFEIEHAFSDIYVFKPGSVHIGVKFRDIKVKKYGYKIQAVEIKIDKETLESKDLVSGDSHFRFYQKWKKYEVDFKYKLLKPSVFDDAEKIQMFKNKEIEKEEWKNENPDYLNELNMKYKSFESQLEHLNIEISQIIKAYLGKTNGLKGQVHRQSFISSWLDWQNPIEELFIVHKKKWKMGSWQSGKIIIQTYSGKSFSIKDEKGKSHQVKRLVMETFSQEDKKKGFIDSKIEAYKTKVNCSKDEPKELTFDQVYSTQNIQENLVERHKKGQKYRCNTSYPQLLEDVFKFCLNQK